jgi:hypothetical protein
MKDIKPIHDITDADFREFVKAVQDLALRAYPNPDRAGCPSPEVLRDVARQPRPSQHPVFQSHIVECSPCIDAMLAERTRIQALHQTRRRIIVAVAASVCLVALLSGLWLWHRAPSFMRDQMASARDIPEIPVDLRPYSPARSDSGQSTMPPISVPIQRVKLKLYLAPGAPLGAYEIRILSNDLRTMRSQQVWAVLNDGVTSAILAVNLADLPSGAYVLVLRPARDGEEWQQFPLVLGRSR